MEQTIVAISNIFSHIKKNLSNYTLLIGIFFIARFIFIRYGVDILLLFTGVLLIAFSFILELSKKNVKKIR